MSSARSCRVFLVLDEKEVACLVNVSVFTFHFTYTFVVYTVCAGQF